jgi:hypothetical protein
VAAYVILNYGTFSRTRYHMKRRLGCTVAPIPADYSPPVCRDHARQKTATHCFLILRSRRWRLSASATCSERLSGWNDVIRRGGQEWLRRNNWRSPGAAEEEADELDSVFIEVPDDAVWGLGGRGYWVSAWMYLPLPKTLRELVKVR